MRAGQSPACYPDGSPIQVGDRVFIEADRICALVYELIQSPQEMADWGGDAPGVMFNASPYGLLFIPNDLLQDSCVERASSPPSTRRPTL